jgi:DNA mismatch repair protein MutS
MAGPGHSLAALASASPRANLRAMSENLTPMMQQYQSIRRGLPEGTILMFRLGDFYEMFFEDAKDVASILNLALTKRNGVPMCGVPHHAAQSYLRRLIKAGRRVAVCDQVSEPTPGRIVERQVTQIITPGTVHDLNMLDAKRNNYLAAVRELDGKFGFAFADLTTGDFRLTELADARELEDELTRVAPAELLVPDDQTGVFSEMPRTTACDAYAFAFDQAGFALREHFAVQSLDGFGCSEMKAAVGAAGAILHYLKNCLRRPIGHITRLSCYRNTSFMVVDAATQTNLDLVASRGSRDTSLLAALDRTVTPMGARKLRDWILHPLCDIAALNRRQQLIADLIAEQFLLSQTREALKAIRDIERTVSRLNQAGGNARDLAVLRSSFEEIPNLKSHLAALRQHIRLGAFGGGQPAPEKSEPPAAMSAHGSAGAITRGGRASRRAGERAISADHRIGLAGRDDPRRASRVPRSSRAAHRRHRGRAAHSREGRRHDPRRLRRGPRRVARRHGRGQELDRPAPAAAH